MDWHYKHLTEFDRGQMICMRTGDHIVSMGLDTGAPWYTSAPDFMIAQNSPHKENVVFFSKQYRVLKYF